MQMFHVFRKQKEFNVLRCSVGRISLCYNDEFSRYRVNLLYTVLILHIYFYNAFGRLLPLMQSLIFVPIGVE